jgi:hypothetical protein
MNKFRKFNEYLDGKGKTVEKPKVDPLADTGPEPTKKPPKSVNKGKNWDNKAALSEDPKDYAPPQTPSKQQKGEKGFAQEGDKKLVYEPDTDEDQKKLKSWPKTATTKEFLDTTANMSVAELVAFMKNESQLDGAAVILVNKVAELVAENSRLMETLVYALKRNGVFVEVTDAPASETEVTRKDVMGKPAKARRTKSIDGDKLDMGSSDVVTTTSRG